VSISSPAIQPASNLAHGPAQFSILPGREHAVLPLRQRLAAAPPDTTCLVVSRNPSGSEDYGTCALCWSGPGALAGSVRRGSAGQPYDNTTTGICSRCLVTLEMLAVQFDAELQLHIETPA
jgi:hypothetical protein